MIKLVEFPDFSNKRGGKLDTRYNRQTGKKKIPTLQKGLECRKIKHTMRKLRPRYYRLLVKKSGF